MKFQDNEYALDEICMKCWQTLSQFNQFCDKIKGIHQKIEVSCPSSKALLDFEEHTEVLEDDEIEENISTDPIEEDFKAVPMLSIESDVGDVGDVGDEGDSFDRRCKFLSNIYLTKWNLILSNVFISHFNNQNVG